MPSQRMVGWIIKICFSWCGDINISVCSCDWSFSCSPYDITYLLGAGSATEVNNFVSKTIAYMLTDPDDVYLKDALMVGEVLLEWWPLGGTHMDELIDKCTKHGYTTIGIPSSRYNINKLYERLIPPRKIDPSEIIECINNNVHIINHLGHANYVINIKVI